ncbi:MAG: hypothetical protein V4450_02220 [Bacteroidota bacterium]
MKKNFLFLVVCFFSLTCFSQDSTHKWSLSAGLGIDPVAVYSISGTDTSIVNGLSISPVIAYRHTSGFGISYSPKFVTGGNSPGIYMHAVTIGVEQYDKKILDYTFNYSHYFFTNASSVPYSPITNEISGSLGYKKGWLVPSVSAGIGFGKNTETTPASNAYDIGASIGVSHGFSWENKDAEFGLTPSLSLNGGTNEYFSLLSFTKYIGRNKKLLNGIKSGKAATALARKRNRNTPASQTSGEKFELSNFELALESSAAFGSFTIRPTVSLYLPVGTYSGNGLAAYWSLSFDYSF